MVSSLPGFPLFSRRPGPNIIAADPWAFLEHFVFDRFEKRLASRANAFIGQAYEFYQAAQNPHIGSKPLLYYYSFLNLAKMALVTSGLVLPESPIHGVKEVPANSRERSRFEGHRLLLERPSSRNVLPAFARLFCSPGGMSQGAKKKRVRVIDVLSQVPGVHRTFAQVRKTNEILLPIKEIQAIRDGGGVRARFVFDRKHWDPGREPKAAVNRVRFRTLFDRRRSEVSGDKEVWYESDLVDRVSLPRT